MKGKAKKRDLRDIGGTVCVSNAYLTYLRAAKCSSSLYHPWLFFIGHANRVVIAK